MNVDFDTIKKIVEANRKNIKIYAIIAIVLLSLLYYRTTFSSEEIRIDVDASEKSITESVEEIGENVDSEVIEDISPGDKTAVSYHSAEAYVDISGEVKKPGVYKVTTSTRLFEVVELAGGLTENADYNAINQAESVYDGEKIIVPHKDSGKGLEQGKGGNINDGAALTGGIYEEFCGLVNINTADEALLQTLPGIGPVKSKSIVEYRNENGKFASIEELKKVNGIGKKTFESIRELITS